MKTGNAFIETTSSDAWPGSRPGWAKSSEAELLIYYLPQKRIWVVTFEALRQELPRWELTYPHELVRSPTHKAQGLIVPLAELTDIAEEVLTWKPLGNFR